MEPTPSLETPAADEREFIAYLVSDAKNYSLEPAARGRGWMDDTRERFANRCLPLLMGNQAGWVILNHCDLEVTWNGGADKDAIRIRYDTQKAPCPAISHFGHGIVTFHLPYLFRTPEDFDLLVRGPANMPKDGVYALDGLVETSWAVATFTMNWKITRANYPIPFIGGEPIAMVIPQRRNDLESFRPTVRPISSDPQELRGYQAWSESRGKFIQMLAGPNIPAERSQQWERHYFQGTAPDGRAADTHRSKLELQPFQRADEAPG